MKLTKIRHAIAVLTLGMILLVGVSEAQARVRKATVKVDGLACPFCVKGVEKHLKKIKGVEHVSSNLKRGEVTLVYKPDAPFDTDGIAKAVVKGGFTPGVISITARGKVMEKEGSFFLAVTGTEAGFRILPGSAGAADKEKAGPAAFAEETLRMLMAAARDAHLVEISGRVRKNNEGRAEIVTDRVSIPTEPKPQSGEQEAHD